jgi:DNA-binding NarL/FixJ family response regulator
MILMLVKDDNPWTGLDKLLAARGISLVHYRDPLKALDNMTETRPAVVVCDMQDFPRHWKILVKSLREERCKNEAAFLLVSSGPAPLAEAEKALFLGVNGTLSSSLGATDLSAEIVSAIERAGVVEAGVDGPLAFLFRHPRGRYLVTGTLFQYDGAKATFKPDFAPEIADLDEGETLAGGSLRLAERVVTLNATVVKNNGQLQLAVHPLAG